MSETAALRDAALARKTLPGRYDLLHLMAFHRALFKDTFRWAGKLRTVEMEKPGARFATARFLHQAGTDLLAPLTERLQPGLKRDVVVREVTHFLGGVNHLHPFREGNGRTQRAFFRQVVAAAGWRLDWTRLNRDVNIDASRASVNGDDKPLRAMLDELIQDRA